jgi:hypothetical protein
MHRTKKFGAGGLGAFIGAGVVLMSVGAPAFATDTREAMRACDGRPDSCVYTIGGDSVWIIVDNGENGNSVIQCPIGAGDCSVLRLHEQEPVTVTGVGEVQGVEREPQSANDGRANRLRRNSSRVDPELDGALLRPD